jgi:hypothetical protein
MDPSWRHLNTITIFPTLHTVPTDNLSQSSWVQPPSSSRDHFDPHIGVGSVAGQHTSQGLTYDGPRYVDVTSDVDKRHSVTGAVANPWVPVTVSGRLQLQRTFGSLHRPSNGHHIMARTSGSTTCPPSSDGRVESYHTSANQRSCPHSTRRDCTVHRPSHCHCRPAPSYRSQLQRLEQEPSNRTSRQWYVICSYLCSLHLTDLQTAQRGPPSIPFPGAPELSVAMQDESDDDDEDTSPV